MFICAGKFANVKALYSDYTMLDIFYVIVGLHCDYINVISKREKYVLRFVVASSLLWYSLNFCKDIIIAINGLTLSEENCAKQLTV